MSDTTVAPAAPLDEVMLAMDVVDTLRHRQDLVVRELSGEARERQLLDKLREIYHQQGIEVPDSVLREGVDALAESRFIYTPPKPGLGVTLARLYVTRGSWGRWVAALAIVLALALSGYFLGYRPYVAAQAETARVELSEALPAQLDSLYDTIFTETKVQQAVFDADALRLRGKTAAAEGDRQGALDAIAEMTVLRDTIRQEYQLRIVNRAGLQSGFYTIPDINTAATNYYVVVEALDPDGKALTLPILNEENGVTSPVSIWGQRVSEAVYRAVSSDKLDDGIIETNVLGRKAFGFIEPTYAIPVLGGAVTEW